MDSFRPEDYKNTRSDKAFRRDGNRSYTLQSYLTMSASPPWSKESANIHCGMEIPKGEAVPIKHCGVLDAGCVSVRRDRGAHAFGAHSPCF